MSVCLQQLGILNPTIPKSLTGVTASDMTYIVSDGALTVLTHSQQLLPHVTNFISPGLLGIYLFIYYRHHIVHIAYKEKD